MQDEHLQVTFKIQYNSNTISTNSKCYFLTYNIMLSSTRTDLSLQKAAGIWLLVEAKISK